MAKEKPVNAIEERRRVEAEVKEDTSINQDALFEKLANLASDPSIKKKAKYQMPPPSYEAGEYPDETEEVENVIKSHKSRIASTESNFVPIEKYAQITRHLERFAFSEGEEKENQMTEIEECLRKKLNEMVIKKVAQNTKTAFVKYANKFSLIPGGIKVGFTFGSKNLFVVAKGNFYGDEIVAIDTENNSIKPQVIKVKNSKKYDLSDQFEINIVKE